jgi:hypothetical protein
LFAPVYVSLIALVIANAFPNLLFCPNTPAIAPRVLKAMSTLDFPIALSISVCFCPLACWYAVNSFCASWKAIVPSLYKFLLFSKRSVYKANSCSFNTFCLSNLANSFSICSASN